MPLLTIEPVSVPLREGGAGGLRVGESRVLLERVIQAYRNGATPEAIVQSYDTLRLSDVYAVLAYFLTRPDEVDIYLARRDVEADAIRRDIEARQPARPELRERLLRGERSPESGRTPAGH